MKKTIIAITVMFAILFASIAPASANVPAKANYVWSTLQSKHSLIAYTDTYCHGTAKTIPPGGITGSWNRWSYRTNYTTDVKYWPTSNTAVGPSATWTDSAGCHNFASSGASYSMTVH